MTCYQFRRRTGEDRPAELIGRAIDRDDEAGVPATMRVETEGGRLRRRIDEAYAERTARLRREAAPDPAA